MVASAVFIMDQKGKILICRNYRGDVAMNAAPKFVARLIEEEETKIKPIIEEDGISYIHVKYNNLYLLATTARNSDATLVLLCLYKMIEVFNDYFKELEEESIRDNFVIIYELLDEMVDFGYPQTTEPKILREYITQEGYKLDKIKKTLPEAVTGAVSWRQEGIKYRRNEVFLDVIEHINLLVSANGTVLSSDIDGVIKMNVLLSGMPELKLGLNDKLQLETSSKNGVKASKDIALEDVKFHQCVRLSNFDVNRTITFVPPDGDFDLMSYRMTSNVKPLIWIESFIEPHAQSRIEYVVKAKSQYKVESTASNVQIIVPVPPDAHSPKFETSKGSCVYVPEQDAVIWTIKQFPGGKQFLMRAQFGLPSVRSIEGPEKKPPIKVKFEIPFFTISKLQVTHLKIFEKSGYPSHPWVRYLSLSGDYQFRMS